ncbi:MAG: L-serine ammonia-lyase, iron-sulfur-dependent, subunit alpha [Betaproteobacteria bacterium]|nr:L-serine ammonia-lyase, iron-sulfur-dependent, subunit alpha [Betaproteobacteria bacterium]
MAYLSLFTVLRPGPGPSSVHTAGPWLAARRFVHELAASGQLPSVARLAVELYGGTACVGRESGADGAIVAGLESVDRARCDAATFSRTLTAASARRTVRLDGRHAVVFDPADDIGFRVDRALANDGSAMRFAAFGADGAPVADRLYLTLGDDVVVAPGETPAGRSAPRVPHDYEASADAVSRACRAAGGRKIAFVALANEGSIASPGEVRARLLATRDAMLASIDRGLLRAGTLPGGRTRSAAAQSPDDDRATAAQRCRAWALAAAEENAAGSGVVAAPSNGAAGIVASLLRHALASSTLASDDDAIEFLATAGVTGALLRRAGLRQVGCQGEVGVAAAMAAAGCAAVMGATPAQALHAAELALEPHRGLSCDPAGGRVESPCIERNGLAAARACAAAAAAVRVPEPHVALDAVTRSMLEAARSLAGRYKQASLGGVALSVPDC